MFAAGCPTKFPPRDQQHFYFCFPGQTYWGGNSCQGQLFRAINYMGPSMNGERERAEDHCRQPAAASPDAKGFNQDFLPLPGTWNNFIWGRGTEPKHKSQSNLSHYFQRYLLQARAASGQGLWGSLSCKLHGSGPGQNSYLSPLN